MNKNNKMIKETEYLEILNEYKLLKEAHNVLNLRLQRKLNQIEPLENENEWLCYRHSDLLNENRELEGQMRSYEEEIEQNKREIEELRDCICNKQKSD